MIENPIKKTLQVDEPVFGIGATGPMTAVELRALADSGVQWVFTDMEHGSIDIGELLSIVQTANLLGLCCVPRIPDLEYHWVARSLDTGSLAVMVPRVETKEQAELAVAWARYPPEGVKGMGSPSYLSYANVPLSEGINIANHETLVVLQIETVSAVESVDAIASVPGVDVLFIGPADMSISLGRPGDVAGEQSHELFRRVCTAAKSRGVSVGIVCQANQVGLYYDMGIRMFSIGTILGHLIHALTDTSAIYRQQLCGR